MGEDPRKEIVFVGYVPRSHLITLYRKAKALIYPSLHETFGMPLAEVIASDYPIVTTNRYAIPEIVGDAALMVQDPKNPQELKNEIKKVIEDKNLRFKLSKRGLRISTRYSWKNSAKKC